MPTWLLPESISDILPAEARKIEDLRRRLLDLYRSYGYELVQPPLLEYLQSLLTGAGQDLDLRTFKLVDQISGRTMGLRADITPQVSRIDAHLLNRQGVARLCYAGSVLHTRPAGLLGTREPLQIGAELYGHAGVEADIEIQQLVLASLAAAGVTDVRLDLTHIGVFRALLARCPVATARAEELHALLQAKDGPGLKDLARGFDPTVAHALVQLPELYGDAQGAGNAIEQARARLPAWPELLEAFDTLERLAGSPVFSAFPQARATIDLADLRGYHYHSGVLFSVYCPGLPNAVARGGRYDAVGLAFGRSRAATGFSLELRELAGLVPDPQRPGAIRAPWEPAISDAALRQQIQGLREAGEIVVQALPGHEYEQDEFAVDRELVRVDGIWQVRPLAAG